MLDAVGHARLAEEEVEGDEEGEAGERALWQRRDGRVVAAPVGRVDEREEDEAGDEDGEEEQGRGGKDEQAGDAGGKPGRAVRCLVDEPRKERQHRALGQRSDLAEPTRAGKGSAVDDGRARVSDAVSVAVEVRAEATRRCAAGRDGAQELLEQGVDVIVVVHRRELIARVLEQRLDLGHEQHRGRHRRQRRQDEDVSQDRPRERGCLVQKPPHVLDLPVELRPHYIVAEELGHVGALEGLGGHDAKRLLVHAVQERVDGVGARRVAGRARDESLQEALRRQEPRRERLKVGVAAQGREVDLLVGRPLDARRAEDGQLACRARPHAVGREAQPAKVHRHARHEVEVAAGEGGEDLVALQVELGEEEGRLGLQLEAEAAAQLLRLLV
mmetsp:Transcript_1113/g.3999  ORF Transcript_1113/g.3999 Transcript_1113/m.3999 type:complete len:386 (-) Transcript_1113:253-1410(-)